MRDRQQQIEKLHDQIGYFRKVENCIIDKAEVMGRLGDAAAALRTTAPVTGEWDVHKLRSTLDTIQQYLSPSIRAGPDRDAVDRLQTAAWVINLAAMIDPSETHRCLREQLLSPLYAIVSTHSPTCGVHKEAATACDAFATAVVGDDGSWYSKLEHALRRGGVVSEEVEKEYVSAAEPWLLMDVAQLAQLASKLLNVDLSVNQAREAVPQMQKQYQIMQLLRFEDSHEAVVLAGMACQVVETCAELLTPKATLAAASESLIQESQPEDDMQPDHTAGFVDEDGDEADEFFIMDGPSGQEHGTSKPLQCRTPIHGFSELQLKLSSCAKLLRKMDSSSISKPLLPRPCY